MLTSSTLALAALTTFASAQLTPIPPDYSPNANITLDVKYNGRSVTPGSQLGIEVPVEAPVLNTGLSSGNPNDRFLVLMVDPDAPTPEEPTLSEILHWLIVDLRRLEDFTIGGGDAIVPYARSMPPPRSSAHRYIQYIFNQPANFSIPAAYSGYSAENRTNFDTNAFIAAAGLPQPFGANYYLCSNGSDAIAPYAIQGPGYNGTGNGTLPRPTETFPPAAIASSSGAGKAIVNAGVAGAVIGAVAMFVL